MAVTVTVDTRLEQHHLLKGHDNLQLTTAPDAKIMKIVKLDFAGTYETGGFTIAPNLLGMGKITDLVIIPPLSATVGTDLGRFVWTGGNVLVSSPSLTATNDMVQLDNASTAITLYSDSIAIVFGY